MSDQAFFTVRGLTVRQDDGAGKAILHVRWSYILRHWLPGHPGKGAGQSRSSRYASAQL